VRGKNPFFMSTATQRLFPVVAPPWRLPTLVTALLVLALLVCFRDTAMSMVAIWDRSGNFTHCFVVPPISLWLIWQRRDQLQRLTPTPQPWVLLPMLLVAVAWQLGDMVAVNTVVHFALVAMVVLAVPAVMGWAVARALLFPLAFLFFAVPFGEFLTPVLMRYTADFTVAALQFSGVPVFREGQQFTIPTGRWSVIEACSGIRYLMASFMVGSLFAYLNYRSARRRIVFVLLSLVVPVLANWMRAYLIVMLGHLSGNRLATGVDHIVYGWVFFGIVITALFFIGARWSEPDTPLAPLSPAASGAAPFALRTGAAPAAWVAALALLLTQLPGWLLPAVPPAATARPVLALPDSLGAWQPAAQPQAWAPSFVEPTLAVSRYYRDSGRFAGAGVGVYIAYYRQQNEARKLVSSVNQMVASEDQNWNAVSSGARAMSLPGVGPVSWLRTDIISTAEASSARPRLTAWRLYWLDGAVTGQDLQAKLLQVRQRLHGRPDDSAAVVIYTDEPDPVRADRQLAAFAEDNFAVLQSALAHAMDRP